MKFRIFATLLLALVISALYAAFSPTTDAWSTPSNSLGDSEKYRIGDK